MAYRVLIIPSQTPAVLKKPPPTPLSFAHTPPATGLLAVHGKHTKSPSVSGSLPTFIFIIHTFTPSALMKCYLPSKVFLNQPSAITDTPPHTGVSIDLATIYLSLSNYYV